MSLDQNSFLGARASNAGDDFLVHWVMDYALELLSPKSSLQLVSIEDPSPSDLAQLLDTEKLYGIDCAFYYGGESFADCQSVEFSQLKYSTSNPNSTWTISKLAPTTSNGPIQSMASTYKKYKDLPGPSAWSISLVSNQQLSNDLRWLSSKEFDQSNKGYTEIRTASGLDDDEFTVFLNHLDFTKCGTSSRHLLRSQVKQKLKYLTESDARYNTVYTEVNHLTLPEGKGHAINRTKLLTWLGGSDYTIFPAPSAIKLQDGIIERSFAKDVAQYVQDNKVGCIHGNGGYGKTTVIQQVQKFLPSSYFVIFDCYGGGTYLSSDQPRHTPEVALVQICNEVATTVGTGHFLIPESSFSKYAQAFHSRIETASSYITQEDPSALLVIIIDAADNAITAAKAGTIDDCFVTQLTRLSSLPENVRILFTCRTSRLPDLQLESSIHPLPIVEFSKLESAAYLAGKFPGIDKESIETIHALTGGIPRVLSYATSHADNQLSKVFEILGPKGKTINELFKVVLDEANAKSGLVNLNHVLPALSALPRPINVAIMSILCSTTEIALAEFCNDLRPGLTLRNNEIEVNDEDFESFISVECQKMPNYSMLDQRIADQLFQTRNTNAYSAAHVGDFLAKAQRYEDLFQLVNHELNPEILQDDLLKRQVRNRRLQLALRCADKVSSEDKLIETLLSSAKALKEDKTLVRLLTQHPDLAVEFARDTLDRNLLSKSQFQFAHGPLNFHLSLIEAKANRNKESAVCLYRAFEWAIFLSKTEPKPKGWKITASDAAAGIHSIILTDTVPLAIKYWKRWKSHLFRVQIGVDLIEQLMFEKTKALQEIIASKDIKDLLKVVPVLTLIKRGEAVSVETQQASIRGISSSIAWRNKKQHTGADNNLLLNIQDCGIEFVEVTRKTCALSATEILPALEKILPLSWCVASSVMESLPITLDLIMRRLLLQAELTSNFNVREHFLGYPLDPYEKGISQNERLIRKKRIESTEHAARLFDILIPIYLDRLDLIRDDAEADKALELVRRTSTSFHQNSVYYNRYYLPRLRLRVCKSLCILLLPVTVSKSNIVAEISTTLTSAFDDTDARQLIAMLNRAKWFKGTEDIIAKTINERVSTSIQNGQSPANDKAAAYILCCKLMLQVSPADAKYYFNQAQRVVHEIDEDAFAQLRSTLPLVTNAKIQDTKIRQDLATMLSNFLAVTAKRLNGYEGLPWRSSLHAIAFLDPVVAMATVAIIHDRGILGLDDGLSHLISQFISTHTFSTETVVALTELLQSGSSDFTESLARSVPSLDRSNRQRVIDILCRDILKKQPPHLRYDGCTQLAPLITNASPQTASLCETLEFLKLHVEQDAVTTRHPVDPVRLEGVDLCSLSEVSALIDAVRITPNIDEHSIFAAMRGKVPYKDRRKHLSVLLAVCYHSKLPKILTEAFHDWQQTPSVVEWFAVELRTYLDTNQDALRLLTTSTTGYKMLLDLVPATPREKILVAISLLANHMDSIVTDHVYRVIGIISQYLTGEQAAKASETYIRQITSRLDETISNFGDTSDLPNNHEDGLVRFIYAILGDPDKEIRWRAAHCIRSLTSFKQTKLLVRIIEVAIHRRCDATFRFRAHQFYWLAAMEWLTLALHRCAYEDPNFTAILCKPLNELATVDDVSHISVRFYLKTIFERCQNSKSFDLTKRQTDRIKKMLRPRLRKAPNGYIRKWYGRIGPLESYRFHFDLDDTLAYWYRTAANLFLLPKEQDFAGDAASLILDQWKVKVNAHGYPERNRRFDDGTYYKLSHSSGEIPQIEDYQTYLEYHAMMCIVGQYAEKFAVCVSDEGANRFNVWLYNKHVMNRAYWLSDITGARPLRSYLWAREPNHLRTWIDGINTAYLENVFHITEQPTQIPVFSQETISNSLGIETITIESALMTPSAKSKLQGQKRSSKDWSRMKIPVEGDRHNETVNRAVIFRGWINEVRLSSSIDKFEVPGNKLGTLLFEPGKKITTALRLDRIKSTNYAWRSKSMRSKLAAFTLQRWSDWAEDVHREVGTFGCRLNVSTKALTKFLKATDMILLVKISVTRQEHYQDYRSDDHSSLQQQKIAIFTIDRDATYTNLFNDF